VIDTNVFVAALWSKRGASHKLLLLVGSGKFELHLSVPLVLEYEEVARRILEDLPLTQKEVDDIIDYLCAVGHHHEIFYLWRPLLGDPDDEMLLELALVAKCQFIITFNVRDFRGIEQFGLQAVTPQMFLKIIGE